MWSPQQNMMWPGQHQQQPPPGSQQPRVPPPYAPVSYGGQQPLSASANGMGQHTQQPPLLPDPTWPNDFMLEQQFSQMSFCQPPPTMFQQPQPPRPMASRPGQPNSIPIQRATNSSGIPSLLDIRVPRPNHMNNGYGMNNGYVRPGIPTGAPMSRPACPPRNNFPMINTSVPPPRITLLQKPHRQTPPTSALQPQVTRPQVTSIAKPVHRATFVQMESPEKPYSNGHTEPEIESEPEKEPEIKVSKILKRPASTPSMQYTAESVEMSGNNLDENLKKREEEYAKVRLRILGSTGMEENNVS